MRKTYKKMIAIGDSITRGTYTGEGDWCPLSLAKPCFAQLVKEALGYDELINYGSNGVSISSTSKTNSEFAISKRIREMESGDMALVAGGTNDYGTNVVLGTSTDREDVSFYGALAVLYKTLKDKYEKVYIITPIRRMIDGKNEVDCTLDDYREAIRKRAQEYGFPVIDGYEIPIDPKTEEGRKRYILDGLHPNTEGHKVYADYVIEKIKSYETQNIKQV